MAFLHWTPGRPASRLDPGGWLLGAQARRLLKKITITAGYHVLSSNTWHNRAMQGFERADRQLLDAGMVAGHLIPAGSMFAFLAAHRAEVFRDADYADLFAPPGLGRPSLPATLVAAVLTLHGLAAYSHPAT